MRMLLNMSLFNNNTDVTKYEFIAFLDSFIPSFRWIYH